MTETSKEKTPAGAAAPAEAAAATPPPKPAARISIKDLQVGDEVESWCGKCKEFTLHKVKTLQLPKPPKSNCLTCRALHQVRYEEPGKKKKGNSKDDIPLPSWPELVAGVTANDATTYGIQGNFEVADVVLHKTFGLGRVVQVGTETRVRISFQAGVKWLIQNYVK